MGNVKRLSEKCLGERNDTNYRKRSKRNERNVAHTLYIEIFVARWIEWCQALKRHVLFVEELSRICREVSTAKGSQWIEVAIEKL